MTELSAHQKFIAGQTEPTENLLNQATKVDYDVSGKGAVLDNDELKKMFYQAKAEMEINGTPNAEMKAKVAAINRYFETHGIQADFRQSYEQFAEKINPDFKNFLYQEYDDFKRAPADIPEAEKDLLLYTVFTSNKFDRMQETDFTRVGDYQIVHVDKKEQNPQKIYEKSLKPLPKELAEELTERHNIPEILKEFGLYHEINHCMGTDNEKKCDTFATLKLLQKYRDPALTEMFAAGRTNSMIDITKTIHKELNSPNKSDWDNFSYIMPRTLNYLKDNAEELIKATEGKSDLELVQMASEIGEKTAYSQEERKSFEQALTGELSIENLAKETVIADIARIAGSPSPEAFVTETLLPRLAPNNNKGNSQEAGSEEKPEESLRISAEEQKYVNEQLKSAQEKKPQMTEAEFRLEAAKAVIDFNQQQVNALADSYTAEPGKLLNPVKTAEDSKKIKAFERRSGKAVQIGDLGLAKFREQKPKTSLMSRLTKLSKPKTGLMKKLVKISSKQAEAKKTKASEAITLAARKKSHTK